MGWKMIETVRDEYRDGSDMGLREIAADEAFRKGREVGYREGFGDAMREVSQGGSYRERMPRDSYRGGDRYPMSNYRGDRFDDSYDYDMGERRRRDSGGRYM